MKKVAIYARSSKDLHNVSCEAQEEQLRELVRNNGEHVFRVFTDKALSSTRDVRPEFDEMLRLAMTKNPSFSKIYCLDTSRFGRDQAETTVLLHQLRNKYGIEVVFEHMPHTGTYMDQALRSHNVRIRLHPFATEQGQGCREYETERSTGVPCRRPRPLRIPTGTNRTGKAQKRGRL